MYKYLTAHETRRWVDICDQLVENYNNTYHSGTKMTPSEASKVENSPVVWYNIYGAYLSSKYGQPKFKVGQAVRISKYKSTFDKGYLPSYTEVVTHQLQVERRTGKVRQSETDVLPLCHATNGWKSMTRK